MGMLGKILFGVLVFPPLYIFMRYLKWSWRSLEKEMQDQ